VVDKVASRSYFVIMRAVGLKILKNKLSEYVRIAAAGETVLVTDRDRVVVEIHPPGAGRADTLSDALLAEAVRKGWLTPPSIPVDGTIPRKPVCQWKELQSELSADRDDR
jgi:antitoxin (DNA-binding transcriptional repressor) of toxin-antitoxin stability system